MSEIESFLRKVPPRNFYSPRFYQDYLTALKFYWNQQRRDALSFLSKIIAEKIDHIHVGVFYRLWIEIAAETHDRHALEALKTHLTNMAPQFKNYDEWLALRGIIHLELEELDACSFILRAIGNNTFSPYALELAQRYNLRFAEDRKGILHIIKSQAPIIDYFILQTLARGILANGKNKDVSKILQKITHNFPHSPIEDLFTFHTELEKNNFSQTHIIGERLLQRFPSNDQFRFNLAFVFFCQNQVSKAIQVLEGIDLSIRRKDPDSLSLLGYGYLLQSKDRMNHNYWQLAKTYFKLAEQQLKNLGLPNSEIALNLLYMSEKENRSERRHYTKSSFWLAPLSNRQVTELMTSSEREIDYLFYPMLNKAQDDDFVFFVDQKNTVLALFQVVKTKVWHPNKKNQAILELIYRCELPLSIEKKLSTDQDSQQSIPLEIAKSWIDQLDQLTPIWEKMRQHPQKERQWQLRKSS